jgi:hypothetical protein
LIARRGRAVFTPSNLSEVNLRFERILAQTEDKVKVPFQADAEIAKENSAGSRIARGWRRTPFSLAALLLRFRAKRRRRRLTDEGRRS